MTSTPSRREFIKLSVAALATPFLPACRTHTRISSTSSQRLFFTSQGKTALIHADTSGLHYFDFKIPDQASWQPGPFLPDGRVIFVSLEKRRDGPGRPFEEYFHKTPSRLWTYDLRRDNLMEIANRERLSVNYSPALLLRNDRLLVQVLRAEGGQIFNMNLDGTDAREFTRPGEGLPYGMSLSPDGNRVAYHLASPRGYQIWTSNPEGGERVCVAADAGHLYFAPSWSPDGKWLAYQDCHYKTDPGHDWCDLCVARPDGSESRVVTEGQVMWFAASYGNAQHKGGGSNLASWTRDSQILFPRRLPGSKVAWESQPQRPDTDHWNRDYKPELASGGVEICKLDPRNSAITRLTNPGESVWDFRATESHDGRLIAFCRAKTGESPALWVMAANGDPPRLLTRGLDDQGVDHPRWLP
jgi:Tol biopolymer transport system component